MAGVVRISDVVSRGKLDERLARVVMADLEARFGAEWKCGRRDDEIALLILGATSVASGNAMRSEGTPPDRLTTVIRIAWVACGMLGIDIEAQKL